MGECTDVASAKRGVRGLREPSEEDDLEDSDRVGVRFRAAGRLFSSSACQLGVHWALMSASAATDLVQPCLIFGE